MVGVLKNKQYTRTLILTPMLVSSLFFFSSGTLASVEVSAPPDQFGETGRKVGSILSVLQDRLTAYLEQTGEKPKADHALNNEFAAVETQKEKWQQYALMQDNNIESSPPPVQPLVTDQQTSSSDLGVVRQNDSNVPQQPSMFEQQAGPMPPILQQTAPASSSTTTTTTTQPPPMQTAPQPAPQAPMSAPVPAPVQGAAPANSSSNNFSPLSIPSVKPTAPGSSEAIQPFREEGTLVSFEQENTLLDFAKLEEEFKNDLKEATHNPSVAEIMAMENEPIVGERFAENNIDLYGNTYASDAAVSSVNKEKQSRTKVTQQVIILNIVFFLLIALFGVMWQKRRAKKVVALADELRS